MRGFLIFALIILFSCKNESQTVDLSRKNITYQERDRETNWKRILLVKPNKWGFVNNKNEIMIPFEYDFINPFENGLAYAEKNEKKIFVTPRNLKLTGDYDEAGIFTYGRAPVAKNKKWGFIDEDGILVIPMIYDHVEYFTKNNLSAVGKSGKAGFINREGKEVVPTIFEKVIGEQLDDLVIARKNYKWAFFNSKGNQLTDFLYTNVQRTWKGDETTFFENGPASVKMNGKYIFLDKNLKPAFPNLSFDSANSFDSNGNAIVKNHGKVGVLKNNGRLAIPLVYDAIENYSPNGSSNPDFYIFQINNRYSFFNSDLIKIAESNEDFFDVIFSNNIKYISFKNLNNKYGLVDIKGNIKIPFIYDENLNFDGNNFSIAQKKNKFGIIDINNKEIVPFNYNWISQIDEAEENLFIISNPSGASLINLNKKAFVSGEEIQSIFNSPLKFIVKRNKKYGIVDLQNKIILPFEYDEISNWTEYGPRNSKLIRKNGKTGLIDENTFKITIPPKYDEFKYINGLIFAKINGKMGIIDESGKTICPFIFDEIYPSLLDVYNPSSNEKRIFVKKGKDYFQIDHTGKILKSNIKLPEVLENSNLPEPPPPKPSKN